MAIFNSYVKLPEGKSPSSYANHRSKWAASHPRQPRHHYCRTVAFRRSRARGADDICCELGPPGTKSWCSWKNPKDLFRTVGLSKIKESHVRNLLKVPNLPYFRPAFWLREYPHEISMGLLKGTEAPFEGPEISTEKKMALSENVGLIFPILAI